MVAANPSRPARRNRSRVDAWWRQDCQIRGDDVRLVMHVQFGTCVQRAVAIRVTPLGGPGASRGGYRPYAAELTNEFLQRALLSGGTDRMHAETIDGFDGQWLIWTEPAPTTEAQLSRFGWIHPKDILIPEDVPSPKWPRDRLRDKGQVTAWRLGYAMARWGFNEEACPYPPTRGPARYRNNWLDGHGCQRVGG